MQTTATQLLALVFEGHHIRSVFQDGQPLFNAKDCASACGISKDRDIVKNHVEPDQLVSISLDTRSASGVLQKRAVNFVTQSGVFALVMGSRKPAARRFQRWLADEVIPQLLKYGTYIPGATAGERCHALHTRWKQERAQELGLHGAALAESGLLTIAAFRKAEPCPGEDALLLSHHLRAIAREQALDPARFFTGSRRHTPAWPRELLQAARRRANPTHFLPL